MSMSIGRILVYDAPRIWRRSPPVASTMGRTVASAARSGSNTRSTPGWLRRAVSVNSRWKTSQAGSEFANWEYSTLRATSLSRSSSRARQTSP